MFWIELQALIKFFFTPRRTPPTLCAVLDIFLLYFRMTYSLRRILTPSSLGGKRIPSRIFPPSTVSFKILSFPSRCNPYPISSSTTGAPTENYIFRSTLPFGTNKRYFSTNDEPKHTVSIPEKHITAFILENATSFGKKPALINSTDGKMVLYEDLPKRVHYAMNHLRSKGVKVRVILYADGYKEENESKQDIPIMHE